MNRIKFYYGFYCCFPTRHVFAIALLLLVCCANPVAPTGGPQDTEPPLLLLAEPENGAVNFEMDEIRLTFNEFVQLKGLQQQFLSSPPFIKNPETKVRGKTLFIDLDEDLRPNTTYSLYFGDAIVDFTEGNPLSNFRYVFSTGPVLDSMEMEGKIFNAYTLKPEKDVFVMLYDDYRDSIPYLERPYYISRTNEEGLFKFTNLRDIPYKIFALRDVNANLIYDQPNEEIGFIDSLVYPVAPVRIAKKTSVAENDTIMPDHMMDDIPEHDEEIEYQVDSIAFITDTLYAAVEDSLAQLKKDKALVIRVFTEVDSIQRIEKAEYLHPNRLQFVFRFPVKDLNIEAIPQIESVWKMEEFSRNNDTLVYWLQDIDRDTLLLVINANKAEPDTLEFSLDQLLVYREELKTDTSAKKLEITHNLPGRAPFEINKSIRLRFSEPVAIMDTSNIHLLEDSVRINPEISFSSLLQRELLIHHAWKDTTRYDLFIPDAAFTGIYGSYNDTLQHSFSTKAQSDYGNIKINLEHDLSYGQLIIQLLDAKGSMLREKVAGLGSKQIEFAFLVPQKYQVKVIHDVNLNGKWDTGIYLESIQPERVYIYDKVMELRANWDIEETFILTEK